MPSTSELLAALNAVGLESVDGRHFRPIGNVDAEITRRFPALRQSSVDLAEAFPFLEMFLVDARRFWEVGEAALLQSGTWTQEDADGEDSELEATAVRSDDAQILLIGRIGPQFNELRGILQSAREKMLDFESLEKLHASLRETTAQLHQVADERQEALTLLSQARDQLEQRVAERTAELVDANERLRDEIARRHAANQQLLAYQGQLRTLADQLTRAEERERLRVAAFLHDRLGQTLALVRINLGVLGEDVEAGPVLDQLGAIRDLVDEVIADTRGLTYERGSPVLYELGLASALQSLVAKFEATHGIMCSFMGTATETSIGDDVRLVLFQGARELLHNVVKHADAANIEVWLRSRDGLVEVVVADDGGGFAAEHVEFRVTPSGGFGLFNLRERLDQLGGSCTVTSEPGTGTRSVLRAPVSSRKEGS